MRKVELLRTRDCEACYGPGDKQAICVYTSRFLLTGRAVVLILRSTIVATLSQTTVATTLQLLHDTVASKYPHSTLKGTVICRQRGTA